MALTLSYIQNRIFEGDVVATVSGGISEKWQRYTYVSPDAKDTNTGSVASEADGTNKKKTTTQKPDGLSQYNAGRNRAMWNQHKIKDRIRIGK